jgi:hypothetical protein
MVWRVRRIPTGRPGAGLLLASAMALAAIGCGSSTVTNAKNATSTSAAQTTAEPPTALHLNVGDFSTTDPTASVSGTTTSGAQVEVNGDAAHVHGTHWTRTVHLEIGSNSVEVEATMVGHSNANDSITITRHHTQAQLEAIAQARKERESREREHKEAQERKERERKEVEERKERAQKEIENATPSQQNALQSAESYLQTSAFSEAGLIEQLSSEAGSKFPHADAVFAVEHLHVNWNQQAVKAAKEYLSTSSFSCQGLIEQLSSDAGSKFTVAQAEYGAKQVGLC